MSAERQNSGLIVSYSFYDTTQANDFPTTIYQLEYDGYAAFPRHPIDFLFDLSAFASIDYRAWISS
jgi:hypothetical protein